MFTVVLIMIAGVVVGLVSRGRFTCFVSRVVTVLIWLLLFLLGVEVGCNDNVVNGLRELGVEALVLAAAGSFGSAAFAWLLWRIAVKHKD